MTALNGGSWLTFHTVPTLSGRLAYVWNWTFEPSSIPFIGGFELYEMLHAAGWEVVSQGFNHPTNGTRFSLVALAPQVDARAFVDDGSPGFASRKIPAGSVIRAGGRALTVERCNGYVVSGYWDSVMSDAGAVDLRFEKAEIDTLTV
ncbi:MAG: hypothetical protein ACYTEQ_22685 [Planctomycetota bacterium]|jgi:hypothetical protein